MLCVNVQFVFIWSVNQAGVYKRGFQWDIIVESSDSLLVIKPQSATMVPTVKPA